MSIAITDSWGYERRWIGSSHHCSGDKSVGKLSGSAAMKRSNSSLLFPLPRRYLAAIEALYRS